MPDAYAVLNERHEKSLAVGDRTVGIKIGFSNRDMWPKYRVAAPVFGYVYHRTHRSLEVAGTVVRASRFLHPRIEPEVVVFLREIPPEEAGADMLPGAIEAIAPALEVVQCASPVWCFDACGAIMQNALHGQLLVGERFPLGPAPDEGDLFVAVRASDGASVYHGDAGNLCGGMLQALGLTLPAVREHAMIDRKAPLLVSTGTLTDAQPITPGERWTFAFAHRGWSYDCTVTVA